MKIKTLLLLFTGLTINSLYAQDTLSVLFLGNSYTSVNNLPQLVQSLSSSAGKTLIVDANMPGGMTISGHVNDATTLSKISQGNWDYVVVQEQSQVPTIDYYRYNDMYPALTDLKFLIEQYNPCARIITYMTWGRRLGGQQCDPSNTYCSPVFADFNHMQDSLTSAYTQISNLLNIQCAPVGVSWQNILNDTALVLHSSDNSHPNIDGSYVAALTIYSALWKATASGILYDAGLTPALAQYYQQMSDYTVFNSPEEWNLNINNPMADFSYSILGTTVAFTNTSTSNTITPLDYRWEFGDGNTSTQQNPTHAYSSSGNYNVSLIVTDCIFTDTVSYTVQIGSTGIDENDISTARVYPNPFMAETRISVGSGLVGSDYTITDLSGKTIERGRIVSNQTTLHLGELEGGCYLLRFGANLKNSLKLIKK